MSIEFPYLIGIALIQKGEARAMPIGGRSIQKALDVSENPGEKGNLIALELLLRVFQSSDQVSVKGNSAKENLLIIQMSINSMQDKLPSIKAEWLKTGDTSKLLRCLEDCCHGIWSISFAKHSGIIYKRITF